MIFSSRCLSTETHSIVQRVEKGKIFRILNSSNRSIEVYQVDGCLVRDTNKRCDFMFMVDAAKRDCLYLVELKGTDHVHALRQIVNAAEVLELGKFKGKKIPAIVGSPTPKAASKFQNELAKLLPKFRKLGLELPLRKNNIIEVYG